MTPQKGFVPVVFLIIAAILLSVPILDFKVTSKGQPNPNVQGTLIAKEGGESGGGTSGSSGDSGSGSHEGSSTSNTGTSGSSGSSGSGGSGDNRGTSGTSISPTVAPRIDNTIRNPIKETEKIKQEQENEVEIEDELENPEVNDLEIKNKDGELEVEVEASGGARRKHSGEKIKVKHQEGEVEIEASGSGVTIGARGREEAETHFPLSFNPTTGQLFVNTPNGARQIRILPDQAAEVAREAGVQNQIDKIELIGASSPTATASAVFKVTGQKITSLLGIIPLSAEVESEVNAETGEVVSVTQPIWLRLLAPLLR